jgi:peptidoglycan L-alanyl-D-glutamate endopeptidase CwlK
MPTYSVRSLNNLSRVHPDLYKVFTTVIKRYDHTITCGWRSHADQQIAYDTKASKLKPGESFHNGWIKVGDVWLPNAVGLSLAVDAAPFPIDYKDTQRFHRFAHYVLGVADGLGVALTWGGDWNRNWDMKDNSFADLPHFELANIVKGHS